jgi:hypothetical protein
MRPPVGYVWKLPVGKRVTRGWLFAYCLEPERQSMYSDWKPGYEDIRFGGPGGFLVRDNGEIEILNVPKFIDLNQEDD